MSEAMGRGLIGRTIPQDSFNLKLPGSIQKVQFLHRWNVVTSTIEYKEETPFLDTTLFLMTSIIADSLYGSMSIEWEAKTQQTLICSILEHTHPVAI